jgi:hypothetical protein
MWCPFVCFLARERRKEGGKEKRVRDGKGRYNHLICRFLDRCRIKSVRQGRQGSFFRSSGASPLSTTACFFLVHI